jgi:hypothetical protein
MDSKIPQWAIDALLKLKEHIFGGKENDNDKDSQRR